MFFTIFNATLSIQDYQLFLHIYITINIFDKLCRNKITNYHTLKKKMNIEYLKLNIFIYYVILKYIIYMKL